MRPDLDDLIGTDIEPSERARLERVHELLVAAGPPPELSQSRLVEFPQRRRRGAQLAIAAALAVAAFAMGATLVDSGRSVDFVVQMDATAAAPGASASLAVFDLDDCRQLADGAHRRWSHASRRVTIGFSSGSRARVSARRCAALSSRAPTDRLSS